MRVYQTLCNEPWCWTPSEVGRLTDYQVREVVFKPIRDRARRRNGGKSRLPTRQEYIDVGVKLGGDPELLGRDYDAWAATQEQPEGAPDGGVFG